MNNASDELAATTDSGRTSWREAIGGPLRSRRLLVAAELLLIPLPFGLRALGVIRNPSLLLLIIGWLSLWVRGEGWRSVGLRRPASWWRTVLFGIGIGIAYDA